MDHPSPPDSSDPAMLKISTPYVPAETSKAEFADPTRPFTIKSLATYLSVSTKTIQRLVKAGKLAESRDERKIWFLRDDVQAYLLRHRSKSNDELETELAEMDNRRVTLREGRHGV